MPFPSLPYGVPFLRCSSVSGGSYFSTVDFLSVKWNRGSQVCATTQGSSVNVDPAEKSYSA